MSCEHNNRSRFTRGFYCSDCDTFFGKDSPTYRSGELLSSIWMAVRNLGIELGGSPEAKALCNRIGIGKKHDNYEDLIQEGLAFLAKHGQDEDAATVVLR